MTIFKKDFKWFCERKFETVKNRIRIIDIIRFGEDETETISPGNQINVLGPRSKQRFAKKNLEDNDEITRVSYIGISKVSKFKEGCWEKMLNNQKYIGNVNYYDEVFIVVENIHETTSSKNFSPKQYTIPLSIIHSLS
jgi:hypothetical protein